MSSRTSSPPKCAARACGIVHLRWTARTSDFQRKLSRMCAVSRRACCQTNPVHPSLHVAAPWSCARCPLARMRRRRPKRQSRSFGSRRRWRLGYERRRCAAATTPTTPRRGLPALRMAQMAGSVQRAKKNQWNLRSRRRPSLWVRDPKRVVRAMWRTRRRAATPRRGLAWCRRARRATRTARGIRPTAARPIRPRPPTAESCATACSGSAPLCSGSVSGVSSCVSSCFASAPLQCGTQCVDKTERPGALRLVRPVRGRCASSATCAASTCGILCDASYHSCGGLRASREHTIVRNVLHNVRAAAERGPRRATARLRLHVRDRVHAVGHRVRPVRRGARRWLRWMTASRIPGHGTAMLGPRPTPSRWAARARRWPDVGRYLCPLWWVRQEHYRAPTSQTPSRGQRRGAASAPRVPVQGRIHAMATLGGNVVLFGGYQGTWQSDTWLWNGVGWSAAAPTRSPAARSVHRMAAFGTKVLLFGGYGGSADLGYTWVWDGTTWTAQTGGVRALAPPPQWPPSTEGSSSSAVRRNAQLRRHMGMDGAALTLR